MNPSELYAEGKLDEAVEAMVAEVKANPADVDRRAFFAELLAFTGEFERADKQLEVVSNQSEELAMGVSLFRQLLHADLWRHEFHAQGRVPELVGEPDKETELRLSASISLREGDTGQAAEQLEEAEAARVNASAEINGEAVDDWRDCDDLLGGQLEILSSTGKYFWVPFRRISAMELHAPERPRDLLWRRATIAVQDGPEGEVYLPTIYASPQANGNTALRLGRATDWTDPAAGPVRGLGQRTFLAGGEARTVMELAIVEGRS